MTASAPALPTPPAPSLTSGTPPAPGNAATEVGQARTSAWIFGTFVGGALILNSYLAGWLYEGHLPPDERIISSLCAFAGAVLLAIPLFLPVIRKLLTGRMEHDIGEMAALAILACFAIGAYAEAGIVAFFLMLAELLETRTALGARAAVEELIRLTPKDARRLRDGREETVPVTSLRVGEAVRIRPGENIPTDGRIRVGESTINQASVTGESLPIDKLVGDEVFAGTVNLTGMIEVEVTRVGQDTTLGKVRDLILQAESTRLPIMRLIDRYAAWYTPTMLMVSAMILYFTGNLNNAITALVVACPCALVLATPTAMVAGLTSAARLGILIKNVTHLESAGKITAILFDKTGTLTTGELTVSRLAPAEGVAPAALLHLAGSADRHSNHPAARALVKVAQEARVELEEPASMQEIGGKGVRAMVAGREVLLGRKTWLEECGVDVSGLENPNLGLNEGFSTIYLAADGTAMGWIGMLDKARPDAKRATQALRDIGVRNLTMVTGDRWGVARRVAGELGCTDVLAECLPEQKLALVESMKRKGHAVMVVGDGVNDAPALAAGDLGVAMGAAGNDIAIHSASIALLSSDLDRLPFLMRLSRRVRWVVIQNLVFAILFVVFGLIAAGMGYLTPILAAVLHNVGSLLVIFNSAKLVRFGEEMQVAPPRPVEGHA